MLLLLLMEITNGCHLAILSWIDAKIKSYILRTLVCNPTGFHANCLRTFGIILLIDEQTDIRSQAITLPH